MLWDTYPNANKFEIERKTTGTPKRINESSVIPKITIDLNGDTIPESHTFIDYVRFDAYGNPLKRYVLGDSIDGPFNIEMTRKSGEDSYRTFIVSNIMVDKPIELMITDNADGIIVNSEKENYQCDLKIRKFKIGKMIEIEKKNLNLSGGKRNLLRLNTGKV